MESSSASSESLSVLVSTASVQPPENFSSNSSEGSSSPSSRRSSNAAQLRDEHYWERRRRNNDSAKRSREKRRMNDLAMEERIRELSAENSRLKSQLQLQASMPSSARENGVRDPVSVPLTASLPSASATVAAFQSSPPKIQALYPGAGLPSLPALGASLLAPAALHAPLGVPVLQLCQLQAAAIQQQFSAAAAAAQQQQSSSAASSTLFSSGGAFHPFRPRETSNSTTSSSSSNFEPLPAKAVHASVIHGSKREHTSPDSSTVDSANTPMTVDCIIPEATSQEPRTRQCLPPPPDGTRAAALPPVDRPPSLLGTLLAAPRRSPTIPQSRTDKHSGLTDHKDDPAQHQHRSDCESLPSPTTSSATEGGSSSPGSPPSSSSAASQPSSDSAIRRALQAPDGKMQQYMDRRKRNNEAAKRCRANRRAVFEYRSRRVQVLEGENAELKEEVANLRREIANFKALIEQNATASTVPPS